MPRGGKMTCVREINKVVLAEYGIRAKNGRSLIIDLYNETFVDVFLRNNQSFMEWLIKALLAYGFKNHARKLAKTMGSDIKGPWHIEPVALEKLLEMWGLTQEDLSRFAVSYRPKWLKIYGTVNYRSANFREAILKGDTIVSLLRKTYKDRGSMPFGLFKCGDPAEETYCYLKDMGYDVCIPSS